MTTYLDGVREDVKLLKTIVDVSRPIERVMAFIDGGYLRSLCKKLYGTDKIEFQEVGDKVREAYNMCMEELFQQNLIRIYYYDAIVEATHEKYQVQKAYFNSIHHAALFTVRLGDLIPTKEGFRQKGIDILMSIDSLTKAYRNQYDTGIFLLGDRDFIPLIEAINDTGKKTIGMYYSENTPEELVRSFDMSTELNSKDIEDILEKVPT